MRARTRNRAAAPPSECRGDREELIDGLKVVGDDTPWTNPGDHGDAFQRIENFSKGRTGGVKACFTTARGA
ncbi:hypothetical protein ACQP1W_13630 [Spirillospora sp. CA-255316]